MSKSILLALIAIIPLSLSASFGQHAAKVTMNGKDDDKLWINQGNKTVLWKDCVGNRVRAQGMLLGNWGKSPGEYVVCDGFRIYLERNLQSRPDERGRLVAVEGELRAFDYPAVVPYGSQVNGFGRKYYITVDKLRVVSSVAEANMELITK